MILNVENTEKPQKVTIEKTENGKCNIILVTDIQENVVDLIYEANEHKKRTVYVYNIYMIKDCNYREELEQELTIDSVFDAWLSFAKEQYAKQKVDVPIEKRVKAVEEAVMDLAEIAAENGGAE